MRSASRLVFILAAAFWLLAGARVACADELLRNADVIDLVKARLADDLIIEKIQATSTRFDTSAKALVRLRSAGVSDRWWRP